MDGDCGLLLGVGDAGKSALETKHSTNESSSGGVERKSTRLWADEIGYDTTKLFNKVRLIAIPAILAGETVG